MKKRTSIAKTETPDGSALHLYERDGEYCISINGQELMSTRKHASEEALATLTCQSLAFKKNVRILIGGLGLGFTLRAALAALGSDAQIIVAELIPAIVTWNRDPNLKLAHQSLSDKRVEVIEGDVAHVMRSKKASFDAILLDVDNGPTGMCAESNNELYTESGLKVAKVALRAGGCLGIWSAKEHHGFSRALQKVGFSVEVHNTPVHGSSGQCNTIYLARLGHDFDLKNKTKKTAR